jgi:hypothetical protein
MLTRREGVSQDTGIEKERGIHRPEKATLSPKWIPSTPEVSRSQKIFQEVKAGQQSSQVSLFLTLKYKCFAFKSTKLALGPQQRTDGVNYLLCQFCPDSQRHPEDDF